MKKLLFITLTILLLPGCSNKNSKIEDELERYVVDMSELGSVAKHKLQYKLIDYRIIDTITIAKLIDSLSKDATIPDKKITLEEFKELRDQEFVKFRLDTLYEERIMKGDLKDASPWCTELRIITEKADSLIENYDKITNFSYDYNYLYWWYQKRRAQYYNFNYELKSNIENIFKHVIEAEDNFKLLDSLQTSNKDDVWEYVILHDYSIHNPLFDKKVELSHNVYLNKNYDFKRYKSNDGLGSLLKQVE